MPLAYRLVIPDQQEPTTLARAPAGYTHERPFQVGGRQFIGGEYIPDDAIAEATPEQKAALQPPKKPGLLGRLLGRGQPSPQTKPQPGQPAEKPNGPPVSPEQQKQIDEYQKLGTRAPSFLAWFGDYENDPANASKVLNHEGEPAETSMAEFSKVRDKATGKPLVVYHGTTHGNFEEFRAASSAKGDSLHFGPGFYFTEDEKMAQVYAHGEVAGGGKKSSAGHEPAIRRMFLDIKKPFDADHDFIHVQDLPEDERKALRASIVQKALVEGGPGEARSIGKEFDDNELRFKYHELDATYGMSKVAMNKMLQAKGYDGITLMLKPQNGQEPNRNWITFDPTQIKSVNNRGTFDRKDRRVEMSGQWEEEKHPRGQPENAGEFAKGGAATEESDGSPTKRTDPLTAKQRQTSKVAFSKLLHQNATRISKSTRQEYEKSLHQMIDHMGAPMLKAVGPALGSIEAYETSQDLTDRVFDDEPGGKLANACFEWIPGHRNGTLHIDGNNSQMNAWQIYAHEIGHILDLNYRHSETPEWQAAWEEEINREWPMLSEYAKWDEAEGWAEATRMIIQHGPEAFGTVFPKCLECFRKAGYV